MHEKAIGFLLPETGIFLRRYRGQVSLQDHGAHRLRVGGGRRAYSGPVDGRRRGCRGSLRGGGSVEVHNLPDDRLHGQPRAGEGRLSGAPGVLKGGVLKGRPVDSPNGSLWAAFAPACRQRFVVGGSTDLTRAGAVAPRSFFRLSRPKEEQVGSLLRKVLILAAPFVWRKYKERRRRNG